MDFDEVVSLRERSAAWRLLAAENAPLAISFLGTVLREENRREVRSTYLAERLDDTLFDLNRRAPEPRYPRPAKEYLDDWAHPTKGGWLRKYHPQSSDEPLFEATPSLEKALDFLDTLKERSFVGTASRLDTVFLLLEKMVFGTEEDPEVRKAELLRRRSEIDDELAAVERGEVAVLTGTQTRELYQQVAQTARSLLSDFREVEENLRKLDRAARERIATYDGPKKELLNELMEGQHDISESDQGQTFEAFYRYLMSSTRQDQLAEWLTTAAQLAHPDDRDPRLERVQHDWAEAAERTQSIVRQLSEQLRRFLDNQVWLENRRVMDLIRQIESASIQLRDGGVRLSVGMEIDSPSIKFELPMERPLGSSVRTSVVDSSNVESGDEDFAADSLFNQQYVDTDRLRAAVTSGVATSGHLTLTEVLRHHPLEQGLAEVVTYLALSDDAFDVVFDESAIDAISWTTHDGNVRVAEVPRILYVATDSTTDSRD